MWTPILIFFVFLSSWVLKIQDQHSLEVFKDKYEKCSLGTTSRLRMNCFSEAFSTDFRKDGTKVLLSRLEETYTQNDNAKNGGITKCHDAAHAIGMLAGMYSTNIQETFGKCSNLCGFGCHMGVIEGYFNTHPEAIVNFPAICKESSHIYSCDHSVGHYVAHATENLEKSLSSCNMIQDIQYRGHCTSGVFMELFDQPIHSDSGLAIPTDLKSFCNSLTGVHKSFCFTMSGFYDYLITNDLTRGINTCLKAPEEAVCFTNFSKSLYYRMDGDAAKMYDFCKQVPDKFLTACQNGVVNASLLSDPILRHGFEFCRLYQDQNRKDCFNEIGSVIENSPGGSRHEREKLCSLQNETDKNLCLGN